MTTLIWRIGKSRMIEIDFGVEAGGKRSFKTPEDVVGYKKMIVEVKASNRMTDPELMEKCRAAEKWIDLADDFVSDERGKPWQYLLLDEKNVTQSLTLG